MRYNDNELKSICILREQALSKSFEQKKGLFAVNGNCASHKINLPGLDTGETYATLASE